MSLQPTMRRRIHAGLQPVIGEEEADALLDAIPDDPVTKELLREELGATKEWLRGELDVRFEVVDRRFDHLQDDVDARFARIDVRFERFEERADVRFERFEERFSTKAVMDERLAAMEHRIVGAVHQALVQQTHRVYGAMGLFALIVGVVDRIWG